MTSNVAKYKKKSAIIEAIQFLNGDDGNSNECLKFAGNKAQIINDSDMEVELLLIQTPWGDRDCVDGDYIIKNDKDEFYPCKPDIFNATYDIEF